MLVSFGMVLAGFESMYTHASSVAQCVAIAARQQRGYTRCRHLGRCGVRWDAMTAVDFYGQQAAHAYPAYLASLILAAVHGLWSMVRIANERVPRVHLRCCWY